MARGSWRKNTTSEATVSEEAEFYEEAEAKSGHNAIGLTVYGTHILVKPSEPETQTAGGIVLPDEHVDRLKHSATDGEIVAMSPWAFRSDDWPAEAPRPKIGDRIVFRKYGGVKVEGGDGSEYRLLEEDEILAKRIK